MKNRTGSLLDGENPPSDLPDWIKVGDGFGYSRLEADGQTTCPDPIYRQFGIPPCKHQTLLLQHDLKRQGIILEKFWIQDKHCYRNLVTHRS